MRHLLSTSSLSHADSVGVLDVAEEMAAVGQREVKKLPALRGRTVVNLFFEDSTRTRTSFEAAGKRLSADVINFAVKGSSVSKGESLKDTAQTLEAMSADAVVIRHPSSGAPHRLASSGWIDAAVLNAGDGTHEHPTQALLDAFTLRRHAAQLAGRSSSGTDLTGMRVAIVGDVLHSRVARSNLWLLKTLGAEVTLVAPPTLLPVGAHAWPCTISYDLDETLRGGVDAVMMLRLQAERMNQAFFPSTREYSRSWGFDEARLAALQSAAGDTVILHPGPMNRGLEISAAAADSDRSLILDQVRNGVSVRMAALYLLLSGEHHRGTADVQTTQKGTST
ncbi:aspartate carbamoyltransferase catalytic subunit [Arthrobacter castelli]|uniref:aspartate carbamoyltransferase catalytic subunit n=1 Tax=Arthrobacter castelli TaxID=271431 RepID=UPI00041F6880|nr:aspartate carbamoyltransferase catalytic subunit [Arthrobacter castelli]